MSKSGQKWLEKGEMGKGGKHGQKPQAMEALSTVCHGHGGPTKAKPALVSPARIPPPGSPNLKNKLCPPSTHLLGGLLRHLGTHNEKGLYERGTSRDNIYRRYSSCVHNAQNFRSGSTTALSPADGVHFSIMRPQLTYHQGWMDFGVRQNR